MRNLSPQARLDVLNDVDGALVGIRQLLDAIGPVLDVVGEDDLFARWADAGQRLSHLHTGLDEARAEARAEAREHTVTFRVRPPVHAWLSQQADRAQS